MNRITLALKAWRELGLRPLALYARYQAGLRSGIYRWQTRQPRRVDSGLVRTGLLALPTDEQLRATLGEYAEELLAEADEIVSGRVRLFGGEPQTLQLAPSGPLEHWTRYGHGAIGAATGVPADDIKFTWEPARFGWACTLARAYRLNGDERYVEAFWRHLETFLDGNPPYLGPHWVSAQEAGLRLIVLIFAAQVFAGAEQSTLPRLQRLAQAVGDHAARIPPTLVYARAQNNNHLLSEAASLISAALALPDDRRAKDWRRLGWRWFQFGLLNQVDMDGEYCQHSTNYHRVMLQLALWVAAISPEPLPAACVTRLVQATGWLQALVDPHSGEVPNLGPNDGAYILPLSICSFRDYRPVVNAAEAAFSGKARLPAGAWDEMGLWLSSRNRPDPPIAWREETGNPCILRNPSGDSWAYLRVAQFAPFRGRPGHADQLHLDLWWRELNLAGDPGTYLYNAAPPWENALTNASVHNTITVNGLDQMKRAGRFLYLDWAQARRIESQPAAGGDFQRVAARHDGYRRLGLTHLRLVDASQAGRWHVEDLLLPSNAGLARQNAPFRMHLQWLLPDWPWELEGTILRLESPHGGVVLRVEAEPASHSGLEGPYPAVMLVRAGVLLRGSAAQVSPTWGWRSPTYGVKLPALSFAVSMEGKPPLSMTSEWTLPG
jgi:Heparinase II/III-like protein/Heparinase II/III N-terminus